MNNEMSKSDYAWQIYVDRVIEDLHNDVYSAIQSHFVTNSTMTYKLSRALAFARKWEDSTSWGLWEDDLKLNDVHVMAIMNDREKIEDYLTQQMMWQDGVEDVGDWES